MLNRAWKAAAKRWRERALDQTASLRALNLDDARFLSAGPDELGFSFNFQTRMGSIIGGAFGDLLRQHPEAENFVEMTFTDPLDNSKILVTIHRPRGMTPTDKIKKLEARIEELEVCSGCGCVRTCGECSS